jgi:hypothetical protein
MADAQEKQARYANQKRTAAPEYKVGDCVFVDTRNLRTERPSQKLDSKREGPYRIVKIYRFTVVLDIGKSKVAPLFHYYLLTKASTDPFPGQDTLNKRSIDEGVLISDENGDHVEWKFKKVIS